MLQVRAFRRRQHSSTRTGRQKNLPEETTMLSTPDAASFAGVAAGGDVAPPVLGGILADTVEATFTKNRQIFGS